MILRAVIFLAQDAGVGFASANVLLHVIGVEKMNECAHVSPKVDGSMIS